MKKLLIYIAMAGATLLTSSCNDWLDVLPKNEQVSPEYWKTKEQVEEVLAQGYQNMRLTGPTLIIGANFAGHPFMLIQVNRNRNYRIFS